MEGLSCGTLLFTHDVNDDVLDVKKKEPFLLFAKALLSVTPLYRIVAKFFPAIFIGILF